MWRRMRRLTILDELGCDWLAMGNEVQMEGWRGISVVDADG